MRKVLFLSIFALCAAPALAAETAQCDATAFTLEEPRAARRRCKAESRREAVRPLSRAHAGRSRRRRRG